MATNLKEDKVMMGFKHSIYNYCYFYPEVTVEKMRSYRKKQ